MSAPLVGLVGYPSSGRTTVARRMASRHGYVTRSFADPLRAMAVRLDPVVGFVARDGAHPQPVRLTQALVAYGGWDALKGTAHGPEVKALLQRFGDAVRDWDAGLLTDLAATALKCRDARLSRG